MAYFGQPASASSGEGQASNGIGGAGLMDLFGGGGTGRGLLGEQEGRRVGLKIMSFGGCKYFPIASIMPLVNFTSRWKLIRTVSGSS